MDEPLSPPPAKGARQGELPAYVSNGVIGLRVRETALNAGLMLVSGYTGEHQVRRIEAAAVAPYPVAGDIRIAGVWMSDAPHQTMAVDQSYDFACGELTSRFEFAAGGVRARVQVITFCSRDLPSLVCQEIAVDLDGTTSLGLKSIVDAQHVDGRALRHFRETPGETDQACDGAALWESAGGQSTWHRIRHRAELVAERGPSVPH